MANAIKEHRLIDSTKRTLVKYVLVADGSQNSNTILLDVSTLKFALNANGYIMSSNTDPKAKYGTSITRIFGQVGSSNGHIALKWHGDANAEIVIVSNGIFDFNFESMGNSALFTNPEANTNGDLLISTLGLVAGDVATILVDLKKDNTDFDAGQTADPYAFNRK